MLSKVLDIWTHNSFVYCFFVYEMNGLTAEQILIKEERDDEFDCRKISESERL